MKTNRLCAALVVFACCAALVVGFSVSTSWGAINDIYRGMDSYPGDPYYSPMAGGPFWPSGWQPVPRDAQGNPVLNISLQSGQEFWLGLENEERPLIKTVWLNFGGQPVNVVGTLAGYEDGTTVPWDLELKSGAGAIKEYEGTIDPQPGWEWVKLKNTSTGVVAFNLLKFTSECVPEPATLALLALAGLALAQKRF